MSLSCFFGIELLPDGEPNRPAIPSQSTLVVTQICVTGDSYRAALAEGKKPESLPKLTLMVQGVSTKKAIAVCTLAPGENIFHHKLSLLFSKYACFSLVASPSGSPSPLRVHLTGYYESDVLGEDEEDEEEEDEEEEEEEVPRGKRGGAGRGGQQGRKRPRSV